MFFEGVIYENCFDIAHKQTKIEKEILYTIAKIESNFNSKAINKNKNKSYDYGLMQINSYWIDYFSKKGYPKSYILSTCGNILVSSYILSYCFEKKKKFSLAIECYNKGEKVKKSGKYFKKFFKYYIYYKDKGNNYNIMVF